MDCCERCAAPDWEAECKRMREVCAKLERENEMLRKDYEFMETEFVRMRAQLDIVYLIFGGHGE